MNNSSQTYVQKTIKNISTIALIMQIIYMLHIALVTLFPKIFLRLCGISNYDFPFDFIHFTGAVINTILFLIFYLLLSSFIKSQKYISNAFSIFLAAYSYIAYFAVNGIVSFLSAMRTDTLISALMTSSSLSTSIGENVAGVSHLSNFFSFADIWLFAAIVLLLIAYAVYIFDCNNRRNTY